ncbi:unnamed protein product [Colias eurytheme]|nr:unnamed protein product [Colias eurytheme]
MKKGVFVCVCVLISFVGAYKPNRVRHTPTHLSYSTKKIEVTIPTMVHLDIKLTKKLAKEYSFKTRKKLKTIVKGIIKDASSLFKHKYLNATVNFKLLDVKFFRNNKAVTMDENATNYLRNYCDWQTEKKKLKKKLYYSVLLTGLDLFYIKNGKPVRGSTARSYSNGVCSLRKSCALLEWQPKNMGYLLAHEIGHSLGVPHDGLPFNNCNKYKGIMESKYDPASISDTWSPCSRVSLEFFIRSKKAWCIKESNQQLEYKIHV